MCGIFCAFTRNNDGNLDLEELEKAYKLCENNLIRRGPDFHSKIDKITTKKETENCNYNYNYNYTYNFLIAASVLWLQGKEMCKQPLTNEEKTCYFAYNGDIFGGTSFNNTKEKENERITNGDTKLFFNELINNGIKAIEFESKENIEGQDNKEKAKRKIEGPYSFIYLNTINKELIFGRDIFGRRSLLIGKKINNKENSNLIFILTSVAAKSDEYKFIELPAIGTFIYKLNEKAQLILIPWIKDTNNSFFNTKLNELKSFLGDSIQILINQTEFIPKKDILIKEEPKIELLLSLNSFNNNLEAMMEHLLADENWFNNVKNVLFLLEKSVERRIRNQPFFNLNSNSNLNLNSNSNSIGVLFSGGIDCAVLALLVDKFVCFNLNQQIDLINVSFFNEACKFESPDRITGLKTFNELKMLRPERKWNFVEVNVCKCELNDEREKHIRHLIYPLNSVLDDSLGCALWFAGRANLQSTARVLLVGMGADELFGGYTRHRNALKRQGWLGLEDSLREDWQNIAYRNLARDDRVISDSGRQLRTPYLDEQFVDYVRNLKPWEKTYPSEKVPQGFGEKILLRSLAYHLGLKQASLFKKRALQFGSKIANSKENGADISTRL